MVKNYAKNYAKDTTDPRVVAEKERMDNLPASRKLKVSALEYVRNADETAFANSINKRSEVVLREKKKLGDLSSGPKLMKFTSMVWYGQFVQFTCVSVFEMMQTLELSTSDSSHAFTSKSLAHLPTIFDKLHKNNALIEADPKFVETIQVLYAL